MNTTTPQPLARLSRSRRFGVYTAATGDRDTQRLMADLAALPMAGTAGELTGGRLAHLRRRVGAAFHHPTAA